MLAPSWSGALLKKMFPNSATEVSASTIVPVAAMSDSLTSLSNTSSAPVREREKIIAVSDESTIDFLTAFSHSSLLLYFENALKYFFQFLFFPTCSSALRISG